MRRNQQHRNKPIFPGKLNCWLHTRSHRYMSNHLTSRTQACTYTRKILNKKGNFDNCREVLEYSNCNLLYLCNSNNLFDRLMNRHIHQRLNKLFHFHKIRFRICTSTLLRCLLTNVMVT